jgi:sarcosine oxidase
MRATSGAASRRSACVRAHLAIAHERGAEVRADETVVGIDPSADHVVVSTERDRYACGTLVVAAGAWLPTLFDAQWTARFRVYRQTLLWFDVAGPIAPFLPERFPVFIWELPRGERGVYGFPALDGPRGGIKVGTESFDATTTADACERRVRRDEIDAVHAQCVAPYLPAVTRTCVRTATCLYTVTPDFEFVVDEMPGAPRVLIASPCSGHGFKHSPAIGEALAGWAVEQTKPAALVPFALERF